MPESLRQGCQPGAEEKNGGRSAERSHGKTPAAQGKMAMDRSPHTELESPTSRADDSASLGALPLGCQDYHQMLPHPAIQKLRDKQASLYLCQKRQFDCCNSVGIHPIFYY